ncbi:DUF6541 family protein [Pseudonocardia endophytica]|uniref:4-amino-4-deoxy-L-arabinose transferase-like glycosyltransferase n=1 Tax=Pseudonocardia endophytica TaxID=401976 RepID=A0A4R1HYB6_PSEEN|nr:DUF6541 family protein [Pseudonocardia endophytica]TCK27398.1 hypothetical protein EV378_3269 [Pseudonocardia endophytica]
MTWAAAVPAALVAAAWCVLPGALVARACGWRGIACWGSAPLVSIALIATTAVVAGRIGVGWGAWPAVAAAVLCAVVALAVRTGLRRVRRTSPSTDRPRWSFRLRGGPDGDLAGAALAAGMVVTVAICWLTAVLGFGRIDAISATYDAVHHYSAVARIMATGDASSLTLGELTSPGHPVAYPAAWHDVVALVGLTSGASIPVASNVVALVVAAVVWPLSCVLLVRQTAGRRAGAFLVAPVLATAFTAMPWMVMTWGVLWPNLLGVALLPAGLAAVVGVLGLARDSALGRGSALLLGAIAVAGLGLAQPNALVGLLVLGLSPLVVAAVLTAVRRARTRRWVTAVAAPVGALAVVLGVVWLLAWSPFLAAVRSFDWPATMGRLEAVRGVLLNGMNQRPDLWAVSVLVVIGAVFALRSPRTAWLVPAHATSAFLYVLAASREDALTAALTGAWYNDSYRLAAMVPVTGVALASLGVVETVRLLLRAANALPGVDLPPERRRLLALPAVAVAAVALVLASDGFRVGVHAIAVAGTYQRDESTMLSPGQREFLDEVGREVPVDDVVAENPWTGNALLYPLTGRQVTFPHLSGSWTPDQEVVRQRLRDAATDPTVCPAVRAAGVTYAIDAPVTFWPWDERSGTYPGLTGLDRAPGFEPVVSGGGSTLYRITACGEDGGSAAG